MYTVYDDSAPGTLCVFHSTGPNFAEGARLQVKFVPICIYISSASCPEEIRRLVTPASRVRDHEKLSPIGFLLRGASLHDLDRDIGLRRAELAAAVPLCCMRSVATL